MTRSLRFVAPALTALTALAFAACTDAPATAPEQAVDMTASLDRTPPTRQTVSVSLTVKETPSGALIGGTTVAFKSGASGTPINVVDNSADDADKRSGYFTVTLSRSTVYQATVIAALSKYDRLNATKQVNSSWSSVSMGTIFMPINPLFIVYVRRASNSVLLGGATFTVGWADGSAPWMQRTDNVDDISPSVGILTFYGRSAKLHRICEITAPAGYAIPSPSCQDMFAYNGGIANLTFKH